MDLHLILDPNSIGNAENQRLKKFRDVKYHKSSVNGTPRRRSLRAQGSIPEYSLKSSIRKSARRTRATMCSPLSAQQNHSPFDSEHPTRTTNRPHMSSLGKASGVQSGITANTRSVTHDRASSSASPPLSTATSSGLSRVRQQLERETARLGRNLSIMDFVLDSKSPWVDFSEEMLLEIAIRSHLYSPSRREYAFGDEHSLKAYWDEQALIWAGVQDSQTLFGVTRFPDSCERSTVSVHVANG
ncbi:hypothetical protein DFS33DRAFT_622618 [Desarmillaria ectypa]|nr:hypothetical protein DFS33DRAFT_622618 [Desarmillaria ectypa]